MAEYPKFDWQMSDDDLSAILTVSPKPYEEIYKQVSERLAHDYENKARLALMELGWTPPKDE